MDWSALEVNHCPKCDLELPDANEGMVTCECGFKIREKRYEEIISNMENKEHEDAEYGYPEDFYD